MVDANSAYVTLPIFVDKHVRMIIFFYKAHQTVIIGPYESDINSF